MSTTIFPTLYGVTSKGGIKVWNIQVVSGPNNSAFIVIEHGLQDGKQQTTSRVIAEGKNIGRANETLPFAQAEAEARSLHTRKQDKGYTLSPKAAKKAESAGDTRLPMLALKFEDRKHDLVWPVYVQPKLDGARCLVERRGDEILFHTRGNKLFTTLKHLVPDMLAVLQDGEFLDGELYAHKAISFQEIMSLIKNTKKPDYEKLEKYVRFWNYDRPSDNGFRERVNTLVTHGMIYNVPTFRCATEEDVFAYHAQFTTEGYEGTMIRSGGDEPYRFKYRSSSLLKYKDFVDDEFVIVGAKEGKGKAVGQAVFTCQTKSGQTFDVRCKGTDADREFQWQNRRSFLNKKLTVQYQRLSTDGLPIFPVGIAVRDYE